MIALIQRVTRAEVRIGENDELEPVTDYTFQTGTQRAQTGAVANVVRRAPGARDAGEQQHAGSRGDHRIAAVAIVHDVVAQTKFLVDDGGQRLYLVGVDLAQLLDPAENVVELGREPRDLLLAHRDAREPRDVADLVDADGHCAGR